MEKYLRTYAEISLEAIGHNIDEVRKKIDAKTKVLAVVKANAYGHGAVRVASYLQDRVDFFAVATADEALLLRENGIVLPIMILGYASPSEYTELVKHDVRICIYNLDDAEALNRAGEELGIRAKLHIALDTGMTRIGFQVDEASADTIAAIAAMPHLDVEGMFTHLSCADMTDKAFCYEQFEKFDRMLEMLKDRKVQIPIRHVLNSAGIMEFDDHRFDMVRSGITTYGCYPSEEVDKSRMDLQPAMEWKTHVIHVKDVEPGRGVSYGATYVTEKPVTRIATVSVGYADGYPRALSSRGRVLIRGQYAPILGRVCMDQMMVDVTDISGVKVEDVVTLIGRDGENRITVEEVGDNSARFNYEMLCDVSDRVNRIYV
ncbi:MAG: alanine racemase [Eubacteriales bacterium]|nr:alanine racemase [Eubacteriales bacterium]